VSQRQVAALALPLRIRRPMAWGRPAFWFVLPAVAVLLVVFGGPMLFALNASFTGWSLVMPGSDQDQVGFENYTEVLTSREYWFAVRLTLIYAGSSVACALVLGTCFALLLNLDFFWRTFFRSAMMIPMVITPSVIGVFWKLLYEQQSGVYNYAVTSLGLPRVAWLGPDMALVSLVIMDVWQITPFFMLVILAGLQSIDENTVAAARVDGAGPLQMFRFILLPHLVPYMLIAASFRIIASMGDFDKIYLLTGGGPGNATTLMSLFAYRTAFAAFDIGRTAAIAWLFVAIVLAASAPLLWYLFKAAMRERH